MLTASNKGDLILDPFLGSGTTAVAAKTLGRDWIGIEKEKKYVNLAQKRLNTYEVSISQSKQKT